MRHRDARNLEQSTQMPAWQPPDWLPAAAVAIWNETVTAVAPGHFAAIDAEMLAAFCCRAAHLRALLRVQAAMPIAPKSDLQREKAARLAAEIATLSAQLLTTARALRAVPLSRREERGRDTALPPPLTSKGGNRPRAAVVPLPTDLREEDLLP